jgi:DNA-binding transcriptional MerR regulator
MKAKPLLIGRLARYSGVKPDTIRFYERSGLLPKPTRTSGGYRLYDDVALKQVRFIRKAQSLGFSLNEIRRIIGLRGHGKETCRCVITIAEATLSETQTKLKQLRHLRDELAHHLARWKRNPKSNAGADFCALIESASVSPHRPEFSTEGVESLPGWINSKCSRRPSTGGGGQQGGGSQR